MSRHVFSTVGKYKSRKVWRKTVGETVSRLWLTLNILKKSAFIHFVLGLCYACQNLLTSRNASPLLSCYYCLTNCIFSACSSRESEIFFGFFFTSYASCEYVAWQLIKVERRERTWEGCMVTLKKRLLKSFDDILGVLLVCSAWTKKWK